MTLKEFNRLSLPHREQLAMTGEFLTFRQMDDCRVVLYSVGEFFIEVFYEMSSNEISMFFGFDSGKRLEPYLEDINLLF